jgi:hypothetical protein
VSASAVQAVLASRLKPHLKLPALCIAWHCSEESGQAWMSKATLARECSVTERNVYRHIEELMTMGVLKRSRKGGGRVTSQYEFDFSALAAADASTPDARAMAQASAKATAQAGTPRHPPLAHASGQTCRTLHLPLAHTSEEKDEKQAKPALSSKTAREATAPGRVHPPAAAPVRLAAVNAKANSQQPPSGDKPAKPRSVYPWLDDDAQIEAKAIELGLPSWAQSQTDGVRWAVFVAGVIRAARGPQQARAGVRP